MIDGDPVKYQDMKLRDAGRLAIFTVGLSLLVAIGLSVRTTIDPLMRGRFSALLDGVAFVCPMGLAMCAYYLLSSPKQNASFIRWAERHRFGQQPLNFDWTLLDPSDPDYNATTFRYLLAKKARSKDR
jgi:hypothetical protein